MADEHEDLDFITIALAHKIVNREQVERCQEILDKEILEDKPERKIEDVMIEKGIISQNEVWAVYKAQSRMSRDAKAIGHRIGGYEILQKIGEGGLGVVYRARQLSMGRDVALKVLHEKWVADEEFRKRFLVEARLVGRLSHQNLIQVYDVGRYKNTYYYSMEFIDGETIEDLIDHNGPMHVLQSLDIIFQMVRAIQYLNQFNIVHRDIKPGNIMLSKIGTAKLGDFGFVKSNLENIISSEGEILGTPDYISPEAALGETDLDFRSDVYSLGATFYHMLTGDAVFKGSPSEVMDKHITDSPVSLRKANPLLSEHLCLVVEKMMAKKREDRYQTASALFDDLELLRMGERSAAGEIDAGKSTVVRALERGRLRVGELLEKKIELEEKVKSLKMYLKIAAALLLLSAIIIGILIAG